MVHTFLLYNYFFLWKLSVSNTIIKGKDIAYIEFSTHLRFIIWSASCNVDCITEEICNNFILTIDVHTKI